MELSKTGGMLQKKDIFMSLDIIVLIKKKNNKIFSIYYWHSESAIGYIPFAEILFSTPLTVDYMKRERRIVDSNIYLQLYIL